MEKLRTMDNKKVTLKELKKIELNPHVIAVENIGLSGLYTGYIWYCVTLSDKSDINLYVKH